MIDQLPAQQRTIFEALEGKGDVMVETLYLALGLPAIEGRARQQQALGPYITRLNRRIAKHRKAVKAGALRGSYTLKSI